MLKTASSKINLVAAVLALVGAILVIVGNGIAEGNELLNVGTVAAAGFAAAVLCIVPVVLKNDLLGFVAGLASIGLNMFVINGIVLDRILMIAGLFSYDSMNEAGWTLFYVIIANAVVCVLSCVATMVSNFLKK